MITKASHFAIFVMNQDSAYDFYVNKLGFKVKTDAQIGPKGRWLTVSPPDQDLEISLIAIDEKMMFNKESAAVMRDLVQKNTFGGAVFVCDDMLATFEELKAKGVKFFKEPTKEFFGWNAVIEDDSGNRMSLTEAKKK
jgi:predicted enzyme related to lactoylglutathione lyase